MNTNFKFNSSQCAWSNDWHMLFLELKYISNFKQNSNFLWVSEQAFDYNQQNHKCFKLTFLLFIGELIKLLGIGDRFHEMLLKALCYNIILDAFWHSISYHFQNHTFKYYLTSKRYKMICKKIWNVHHNE